MVAMIVELEFGLHVQDDLPLHPHSLHHLDHLPA